MKKDSTTLIERRALAFIIDVPIAVIIVIILFFFYSVTLLDYSKGVSQIPLAYTIISLSVMTLKDISGASVGKRILKLKVVPSDGNASCITLRRVVRNMTFLIWPIEALSIMLSGKRISDRLLKLDVVSE